MMAHETASRLYQQATRTKHRDLMRDLERAAVTYAHHRATCALASAEERREMDAARTAAHNAFIDTCNILSRAMGRSSEDNSWRATLGDDRKVIGDFACRIHCQFGITAR
jgi:hypothetical protein